MQCQALFYLKNKINILQVSSVVVVVRVLRVNSLSVMQNGNRRHLSL